MHEELKDKALAAIDDLFSDTSVPGEVTIESLQELMDDLSIRLESLE